MVVTKMGLVNFVCYFISLILYSAGTEYVPALIWESNKPSGNSLNLPVLKKLTAEEFSDVILKKVSDTGNSNKSLILAFTEETLSIEDFSWRDVDGNSIYKNLESVTSGAGAVDFIPAVQDPSKGLKKLLKYGYKTKTLLVPSDIDAFKIPEDEGVILFLKLDDAKANEDRPDFLRRHDRVISELYSQVKQRPNVVAVYTGHYSSWSNPSDEPVHRVRRLLADVKNDTNNPIILETPLIVIYSKSKIHVNYGDETLDLLSVIAVTKNEKKNTQELKAKFQTNSNKTSTISLEFIFTSALGYWKLNELVFETQTANTTQDIHLTPSLQIEAPIKFSYHCSAQDIVFQNNNTVVTFKDIQVQAFMGNMTKPRFGDSYDCVFFFTAPIWSGLFITAILALILIWGLVMIMDIRTMDQFDDPKAVSAQETSRKNKLHISASRKYPAADPLPLPTNVEELDAGEKALFSPHRERDISGPVILSKTLGNFGNGQATSYNTGTFPRDRHVNSYDCRGTISLSSSMQTNVPEPFSAEGKVTFLNMPGGQWGQGHKYLAEELLRMHHENMNQGGSNNGFPGMRPTNRPLLQTTSFRYYCSKAEQPTLSRKDKLKRAVKEYGATVIVFHVGISLISLGGFYLAVSSGLDMSGIMKTFGVGETAAGASTFVAAYAIHKVFAPVRISITLTATPFIVRYLRNIGFLKVPKVPMK